MILTRGGSGRLTKTSPKLAPGEVVMKLLVQVPDAAFHTPVMQATVIIPDSAVKSEPIAAEVQDNVIDLIRTATGLEVKLTLESPAEQE